MLYRIQGKFILEAVLTLKYSLASFQSEHKEGTRNWAYAGTSIRIKARVQIQFNPCHN